MTVKPKWAFAKAPKRTCKNCRAMSAAFKQWEKDFYDIKVKIADAEYMRDCYDAWLENMERRYVAAEADKRILQQDLQAEQMAHDEIGTLCFHAGATSEDGTSVSAVRSLVAERDALVQENLDQECAIIGLKGALELAGKELAKYKPGRTICMMQKETW